MRKLIGGLLYGLALLLLVWVVGMAIPRAVTRTAQVGDASVTLSADRQWVLFPGECVEVRWTLQNVHAATFFPKVEPGIDGGAGVRSVFFTRDYKPGLTITEDAAGGVPMTIDDPAQTVNGAGVGCIDYTTEPKLRAFFADGSSQSFKLGLDVFFLRMEVWLLIFGAGAAFFAASLLIRWPSSERVGRLSVWLSAALLTLYTLIFAQHPRFLTIYWLDVVPFAALVLGAWGLSVISVARPDAFDRFVNRARASTWLVPSVFVAWLWLLAFGYYQPNTGVISELLWLPLYLWAFVAGMAILWVKRPREQSAPMLSSRSWRVSLITALIFAGLSFARDWVVFEPLTARVIDDSNSYLVVGSNFMKQGATDGLPSRIFPYAAMVYFTRAWENPVPLALLQAVIGALSVGALVYVLSRRRLWLGIGVGLLLIVNLAWGTYNRSVLTEGPFISFNLLSFAVLLWHTQRGESVRRWELLAAGVLYAWTFLFRGTGLALIIPVLLVYGVTWRRWRKPLWVLAGFAAFLLGVAGFNQWRYNEFGLISSEYGYGTAEAGLFAYHLFSPQNGVESARIDAALRECMGYLDYDDPQRFGSDFLTHFHSCLNPQWGRATIHSRTFAAIFEIVRYRTFDFARLLIREWGVGFTLLISGEFDWHRSTVMLDRALNYRDLLYAVPDAIPPIQPITALEGTLQAIDDISFYPLQPYLLLDLISSRSAIVMLAAFAMMSGAALVFSRYRGVLILTLGFLFYQIVSTTLIYYANSRYLLIVLPFMTMITVPTIGALINGLRRVRPRLNVLTVLLVLFGLVYVSFANPTLRQSFTAPLSVRLGVNLLEKYGLDAFNYQIYQRLQRDNITALFPTMRAHRLQDSGVIKTIPSLSTTSSDRLQGWQFTRLPGYVRDAGFNHLLIDETIWAVLPPFDRDTLQNPEHYRLLDEWRADERWQRLYEVVGDARGTYQPYATDRFTLFVQPNDALHVYQLDENRNGTFALAIDPQQVLNGQREFRDDASGWSAVLRERFGVREYTLEVYDEAGALVDDGYILRVP